MSNNGFDKITEMKKRLQETIKNDGIKILKEEVDRILEILPEVECILWGQNNNVYNDESYEFRMFGIDFLPSTTCSWYTNFIKSLENDHGSIKNAVHFHGETLEHLHSLSKNISQHRDRMLFIYDTLSSFGKSIPEEVLQVLGNVTVRIDRKNFSTQEYDCGY